MHRLLIISILSHILECIAPIIIKYIISWIYSKSNSDYILQDEMMDIRKEMNTISMVDEFAKYAKLQRKYNKLESVYKEKINARLSSKAKVSLITTCGLICLNYLLNFILLCMYRGVLVITLSEETLWPIFNLILSWPSEGGCGISFLQWSIISRLTISILKRKLSRLL